IFVVLLQAGKGGGMGLAFGGGQAQTMFGGSGAGNFLTRLTAVTAVVFMLTSLTLAYLASARGTNWLTDYEKKSEAQGKRGAAVKEKLGAPDRGAAAPPPAPEEGTEAPKSEEPPTPEAPKTETPTKAEAPKTETPAKAAAPKTEAPATAPEKPAEKKPQ